MKRFANHLNQKTSAPKQEKGAGLSDFGHAIENYSKRLARRILVSKKSAVVTCTDLIKLDNECYDHGILDLMTIENCILIYFESVMHHLNIGMASLFGRQIVSFLSTWFVFVHRETLQRRKIQVYPRWREKVFFHLVLIDIHCLDFIYNSDLRGTIIHMSQQHHSALESQS